MQGLSTYYPVIMDVPDKPASLISASAAYITSFSVGQTSWTCPVTGFWSFVCRGGGGDRAGGSGAAAKRTVYLVVGQIITFVIGKAGHSRQAPSAATATVVTFPDGQVMTAGPGINADAVSTATATGGDINISGYPGAAAGTAAPDIDTFPGAPGVDGAQTYSPGPGAGAGFYGTGGPETGGPGILYIYSVGQ